MCAAAVAAVVVVVATAAAAFCRFIIIYIFLFSCAIRLCLNRNHRCYNIVTVIIIIIITLLIFFIITAITVCTYYFYYYYYYYYNLKFSFLHTVNHDLRIIIDALCSHRPHRFSSMHKYRGPTASVVGSDAFGFVSP